MLSRMVRAARLDVSVYEVVAAARELGCSDAYIHQRLKEKGLKLRDILEPGASSRC